MPLRTIFSRETRLLVTTLVVAVAVLFLLARYRFPQQNNGGAQGIVPRPLDRWVASSSYDELAASIDDARLRVSPSLEVLRLSRPRGAGSSQAQDLHGPLFVPALRFRTDLALAVIPEGAEILGVIGPTDVTPVVVARDLISGLSVVRVSEESTGSAAMESTTLPAAPVYLAEAFGTPTGPALKPVFAGRTDVVQDPRWDASIVGLHPSTEFTAGRLVFTLNGRLAGVTVSVESGIGLVPAGATLARAEALLHEGPRARGDVGIAVQALTPSVARAVGATVGVVVRHVFADGPAKGLARTGDVIEAIDGTAIYTPDAFEARVGGLVPGSVAMLRVTRFGKSDDVPVPVVTATPQAAPAEPLGLTLRPAATGGAEVVAVLDPSLARRAGLRAGDVITLLGSEANPRPADIEVAFAKLESGASLLLGLVRQREHLVLGLDKP